MANFLLNSFIVAPSGAQAAAVIARMTALGTTPNGTRQGHIETFVNTLVAGGVLQRLDLLYLMLAHSDAASRINFAQPATYDLTKVNTPTFTVDGGWVSAATSYLDSGFNPSTAGGKKLAQNDVSYGAHVLTDAAEGNNLKFLYGVTSMRGQPRNSSGAWAQTGSATGLDTAQASNGSGVGMYGVTRTGSTNYDTYKGGAAYSTITRTSTAPTNANFLVLTHDGTNLALKTLGLVFAGASLSATQHDILYDAYIAYATAIGVTTS
jgi:hypothetical protein